MTREITTEWIEKWGVTSGVAERLLQHIIDGKGPGLKYVQKNKSRNNSNYTEEQIREVCEVLRDRPELSLSQIALKLKIGRNTVETIYRRIAWTDVSIDYDFSAHRAIAKRFCKAQYK